MPLVRRDRPFQRYPRSTAVGSESKCRESTCSTASGSNDSRPPTSLPATRRKRRSLPSGPFFQTALDLLKPLGRSEIPSVGVEGTLELRGSTCPADGRN